MSTTTTIAPAGTWTLDPVHSSVGFEVSYLGGTFRGEFHDAQADLRIEGDRASVDAAARVASVDVKDENLTAHLQSPDFFDAERHPEIRFHAEDVGLESGTIRTTGELTIKGVTKPVDVTGTLAGPLSDQYGNERVGIKVEATVDRTEFGVSWNAPLPSGEPALANDVRIACDLYFVRA